MKQLNVTHAGKKKSTILTSLVIIGMESVVRVMIFHMFLYQFILIND